MSADRVAFPVFEFLDSTHRDIQQRLRTLHRLVEAIESSGLNAANRELAREVLDFFNGEARQHHLDEEKHIFPALLGSQDAAIVQAAEHLRQDHGWLEENWLQMAPSLEAAASGNLWFDPQELHHALEVFEALYLDHILLQEAPGGLRQGRHGPRDGQAPRAQAARTEGRLMPVDHQGTTCPW